MAHPEYLYWFALAVFGVPAIAFARAIVPALAMLVLIVNIMAWHAGMSWQGEGLMLSCLYATMLTGSMRLRLDAAETMAAALWSPMAVCALAQAIGALPTACYWAIYGLALAQALVFAFIGAWPVKIVRRFSRRVKAGSGELRLCPA